jgi:hypothetical protein
VIEAGLGWFEEKKQGLIGNMPLQFSRIGDLPLKIV